MSARAALVLSLFLGLACNATTTMQTGFLDRTVTLKGTTYRYVVYVPQNWSADKQWPVILFLHGAGERGSDGMRQTQYALAAAIRWERERFPAVVVFPQAGLNDQWIGAPVEAAMRALDASIQEFNGDPQRVYLTGLSLGGFGVWHLALAHPDRFAALVPICGGIVPAGSATSVRQSPLTAHAENPYAFTAQKLRHIPAWIFHGADDPLVLPSESRKIHEALKAVGANVRYTEYEGVGHNSWDRAYGEERLWMWLFAQRRTALP